MNRKKNLFVVSILMLLLVCVSACQAANPPQTAGPENTSDGETMIYAHIGNNTLTIRPERNSSAEAFAELLQGGDITVNMHDYGSFEKVGLLGAELPTNDESITTEPGDVILYQGNQITIYYDTNTWSFTRLGKVQGMSPEEIRAVLGDGDPTVVFSLSRERKSRSPVGEGVRQAMEEMAAIGALDRNEKHDWY